jgi:hypothetical protein
MGTLFGRLLMNFSQPLQRIPNRSRDLASTLLVRLFRMRVAASKQRICFSIFCLLLFFYFSTQLLWQLHVSTYVWQTVTLSQYLTHTSRDSCPIDLSMPSESSFGKVLKIGMVMVYSESDNGEWGPDIMEMVVRNKQNYAKLHGYDVLNGNAFIDPSRPVAWSKILAVEKHLLAGYDYLFYIDMDAVVMNPDVRLEALIAASTATTTRAGGSEREADFIMTEDWNGLNTGVWFAKNTLWAKTFLELAWNQSQLIPPLSLTPPHGRHPFEYEQRAFHYLLDTQVWRDRKTLPRYRGEGVVIGSAKSGRGGSSRDGKGQKGFKSSEEMRSHFALLPQCSMNSYSLHPLDPSFSDREDSQVRPVPPFFPPPHRSTSPPRSRSVQ